MKFFIGLIVAVILAMNPSFGQTGNKAEKAFKKGYKNYAKAKYDDALEFFNSAIKLSYDNSKYYYFRGVTYSMLDQDQRALSDLSVAIELTPDYEEAWFERAMSHFKLDMNTKSLADYNRAIQLNTEYGEAYFNRASVKFSMDERNGACADWYRARDLGVDMAKDLIRSFCQVGY